MASNDTVRKYGSPPFGVAVIHGGPGWPGYMAPVARELAARRGVLEPLQTRDSLDGQVEELREQLAEHAQLPAVLVGSSWGAMLSYILAARRPEMVRKIIMISSAVFDAKYSGTIMQTSIERLSDEDREKVLELMADLSDPEKPDKSQILSELNPLHIKSDSYDPVTLEIGVMEYQHDMNENVWAKASQMRKSGELLEMGKLVRCPVVAIHGDYDPRPAEGVRKPLSQVLSDFRFILLEKCGHFPWIERHAKDRFFEILEQELS